MRKNYIPVKLLLWSVLASLYVVVMPGGYAAPTAATEYEIKAAFLYNFANFVTWPSEAFNDDKDPFRICILGKDPFETVLDTILKDQKAGGGRGVIVHRIKKIADTYRCHILFVSNSEQPHLSDIFAFVKDYPILTVSDIDNFIDLGGMIKLFNRNNKVRIGINPDVVEQARLKADANLLRLAEIMRVPQE